MNEEKVKNLIEGLATELNCDKVFIVQALYDIDLITDDQADELEK